MATEMSDAYEFETDSEQEDAGDDVEHAAECQNEDLVEDQDAMDATKVPEDMKWVNINELKALFHPHEDQAMTY